MKKEKVKIEFVTCECGYNNQLTILKNTVVVDVVVKFQTLKQNLSMKWFVNYIYGEIKKR